MLETERLGLVLLTAPQLRLWTDNLPRLEQDLNCSYQAEPVDLVLKNIISKQAEKAEQDSSNLIFHSFLFLIRKSDGIVVGSADFKDVPNQAGEVEIGYGLGEPFYHCGYMTEAVKAMCSWGLQQPQITCIIAETDVGNIPSHNVLKRCGFAPKPSANGMWWQFPKKSFL